jgi:hypothetical protein
MMTREQWILSVCLATFGLVLFIAILLVRRHGHTIEAKAILDAVEGEGTVKGEMSHIKGWLAEIRDRFGFLRRIK